MRRDPRRRLGRVGVGSAFLAGVVAGLAVAVPLGGIGVLLLAEGAQRGVRAGLPAAAGVASVDAGYGLAACLFGALATPLVARLSPWPGLLAGLALLLMAVVQGHRALRGSVPGSVPGPDRGPGQAGPRRSAARRYAVFVGLTAINPATLGYFAAVTTALRGLTGQPPTALAFATGVGLASVGWQSALVAVGAVGFRRADPRVSRATGGAAAALVAVLGVVTVVQALRPD